MTTTRIISPRRSQRYAEDACEPIPSCALLCDLCGDIFPSSESKTGASGVRAGKTNLKFTVSICLIMIACAGMVRADVGSPCWSGRAGGYQVAVFQSPSPLRVGTSEISLLVQDAATREFLPNAHARVRFTPRDQPDEKSLSEFEPATSGNRLLQSAPLHLPQTGWWDFELTIDAPLEPTALRFSAEVADTPPRWLTFWPWFSWPAVAVVLFGIHQWLVAQAASKRT